ncbi:hypothetical protein H4I96_12312 [Botrytis cinerea]
MRTAPLENHTDETETGVRYTNAQWKCIQRIRNKLDENTPADDETEDRSLINALMCLSVRGVDEQSQSLRSAFCYTPIHNDKTNLGSSWFISPYNPHINAHLKDEGKHKAVKAGREHIVHEIQAIRGLKTKTAELNHLVFPPIGNPPIPILQQPRKDGLKCQLQNEYGTPCQYIACQLQKIQKHCRQVHQWENPQKKGRPETGREVQVPWRTGVHCQHFFVRGPGAQFFEVQAVESSPAISLRDVDLDAAKMALKQAMQQAEEDIRHQITEPEAAREPNPWLRRVGWVEHLEGFDRTELQALVAPVRNDEPELEVLCRAFDWLIQDAQYHCIRPVVGLEALFEANRKEVDQDVRMPFDSWMDITTVIRYTEICKQLLRYIFRSKDIEPEKRPGYGLTERQQICIEDVWTSIEELIWWKEEQGALGSGAEDKEGESDEEIEWIGRIQRQILRLWMALLNQPLQDDEYKSVLISGLAVLGMREDDGWLDAEDYTPKYSAVIKLARLMVVQEAYERRREAIAQYKERGLSPETAKERASSHYTLTRRLVRAFMTMAHDDQDPKPMQWLYRSRSYGFKIRYTTTAEGKIQWIGDDVLYANMRFGMSQFRGMIHGLVGEAREELFEKLMVVRMSADREVDIKQVPPIHWNRMVDQPSETRVGWSFLDDERNQFAVCKQWWLYERMYKEEQLREQFMNAAGKLKREAVAAFQHHVERFQELLWGLMHVCGGQPARAPELLGMRWKNTAYGGVRNIFIEEGLVAFVATYHKGYRSSGNIKIVHRYLPREVGELLVYYLWLVLPFWEKLQFQVTGKPSSSPFLWGDGQKKEHRQWTGPKRKQLKPVETDEHPEERRRELGVQGENESRHQTRLLAQRQARTWSSERARKILREAAVIWMGVDGLNISGYRQIAIAISRRYCREDRFEEEKSKLEESEGWDEDNADGDDPWDLQAGHGTHVAGMIYARELMEGENSIISRREKFRRVSHVWHCFLGFPSAHQGVGMSGRAKRKRQVYEEEMQDAQLARWKRLRGVDIHAELEKMLGSAARFRGLQEPVLQAIMKHQSPIVAVMGTGVGKTLLFQLPAKSMSSGTTVVISPLVSLQDHMVERCQQAGISCVKWDARQCHSPSQIVIVTPESAVSKTFGTFLDRLQGLHLLERHLSDQHRVPIKLRKQLEEYIKEYPFQYDYTNIQLPSDSSAPQPIIPVLDGYKCQSCQFKTHGRDTARQHCNKVHNQKRMADEEMFQLVKLQCWFGTKRGRFWIVDEAKGQEQERQWWASPKNEAADQRPFEIPQNAQSVDKYSRIFACFICYMMRTAPLENHTDETETGVRYTNAQWKCIQRIRNKLDENTPADDETEDRSLINALMCLSVRGVDEQSQSLRSAFCYTPILAGMLWVNRLIMLEVAVPCEPWPELQLHSKADVDSVRDRIHQLRALHLCEGSFSPTSSILTQLAMGKKFNKIHQSPSNIHWSDDEQTINYLGQPVVLAKIERMCHTLIGELQALMNVLTFGSPVPPIDLSRIVDSMAWSQAFRRQNFSFITHAQNQDQVRGDYGFLLERARRKGGDGGYYKPTPQPRRSMRVRPFARALDHRESEYLFGDLRGPWAGEELSQALGSATRKHLGVYLRASGWRHTAIGIATRYLMRASKTWEKEHEDPEDGGDEFAEGDDDEELELDTFRHIMVRQSGHGRRVAQAHYAIDGAFLHRLGPELITAYEQASTAWHGLWKLSSHGVGSRNSSRIGGVSHRRDASQQLSNRIIKRGRIESSDPALVGLQRIYHDPQAKPRSEGQASALQLVHHPSTTQPLVIVLPTSSGKSALFFSVAAMTEQQTVVVVVPFAALVDDIIERGRAAGLDCTEWIDETSGHELSQLIVVSADRAVQGPFLHYAKGLELGGQLAHVFFDEVHVAFTDTSYRERLRDLWTLRYLDCPFTGLTATLIVDLEDVLRERLCIDNAQIFRRSTARKTIRYQVRDSKYTAPSEVAIAYVQRTRLSAGKRGVIYVRSYETGRAVSDALACPFYRARAELKGEVLQQWVQGPGGWIVATGALGTGINIEGIIYVVHVGRPYGLTSFVQQSGRGGRNGEVSESIIITRVEHSRGRRRREIMSEYSVEQIDEDAMTEFIQAPGCRRQVLGRYMDGTTSGNNCSQTDSVLCDQCWNGSRARGRISTAARHEREVGTIEERTAITGADIIQRRLGQVEASQEQMMAVMDRLQGDCIYCGLMKKEHARGRAHAYQDCLDAVASGCGRPAYQAWREKIDLGSFQHCWKCGLSQRICRRLEDDGWCEYPEVMLPGIFILHQQQHLPAIVEAAGFHGDYTADIWEWLQEVGEGFGRDWESNWMKTWRMACEIYARMMEEGVST